MHFVSCISSGPAVCLSVNLSVLSSGAAALMLAIISKFFIQISVDVTLTECHKLSCTQIA